MEVVPTIVSLQEKMEKMREKELAKTLTALPQLSAKERRAMEALSQAIINKILHGPITQLKKTSHDSEGEAYVDIVKKLFQLDEE